jgi:hypothetical protein
MGGGESNNCDSALAWKRDTSMDIERRRRRRGQTPGLLT